jgi:hypothetical protein
MSGTSSSILFNDNSVTTKAGEWGIEYEATPGGLNFWKPFGNTYSANYILFLKDDGNIGIGTESPDYKLDVCGTIRAKEVKVAVGWCDFVFDSKYKLMPLTEVEKFIKKNKHLPGINPGAEIETDGLNMGEMQAKHMLKIEELTLYLIEQNKKLNELKQQNDALQVQVNSLLNK